MARKIWMTGATGFVGSHFLYRLLTTTDACVVAILRDKRGHDSRARLLRTLEQVAWSYRAFLDVSRIGARLEVVSGDITEEACGVSTQLRADAAREGGTTFWHMAASLSYEDRHRAHIRLHNVDGTRHALTLAEQLGAERFVYVSTAYTCGRVTGLVEETLHSLDRPFNNVYEQTKCEAEHLVHAWSLATGTRAAILRPSVVVGPEATHSPGGSDTGLYGFARETTRLKRMLQAAPRARVMLGDGEAELNLVPVDALVNAMTDLAEQDFAGGLVHHLTAAQSPSVDTVLATVGRVCGAGPIQVVSARSEPPSPVERAMDRRAEFYASYLRAPKTFARRAGTPIRVDDAAFERFVRAYARQRRSETADAVFARSALRAADGTQLVSYEAGSSERPVLVLCNAYGLDPDIWVPLAQALGGDVRLLTWTPRTEAAGPDDHAADLRCLLDQHGVDRAYLAGYCTGADVALRFAELAPERVLGVACLSGALNAAQASETPFQRNMRKLAQSAARDLVHARLYHQLLFGAGRSYDALLQARTERDEAMLASMVGTLDPELLHLTSAPFRDAETLHAYARSMQAHYAHCARTPLPALAVPTLFVIGLRDAVAHPEASRQAAARMLHGEVLSLPEADHFALYNDPAVAAAVSDFVSRCEARRSGVGRAAAA